MNGGNAFIHARALQAQSVRNVAAKIGASAAFMCSKKLDELPAQFGEHKLNACCLPWFYDNRACEIMRGMSEKGRSKREIAGKSGEWINRLFRFREFCIRRFWWVLSFCVNEQQAGEQGGERQIENHNAQEAEHD